VSGKAESVEVERRGDVLMLTVRTGQSLIVREDTFAFPVLLARALLADLQAAVKEA
jgi:hypothetical protein